MFVSKKIVDITQQCFALFPQVNFHTQNLNFHWIWRWWDQIQAIFLNLFYFTIHLQVTLQQATWKITKYKRTFLLNWIFLHIFDVSIFFSSFFSMNIGLNDMPPCVPICRGRLPKAPTDTDLLLKYVIPRNNQSAKIIYSDYLANNKYRLFSGDRLVYECTTEFWGVFGGVDTSYENFRYFFLSIGYSKS